MPASRPSRTRRRLLLLGLPVLLLLAVAGWVLLGDDGGDDGLAPLRELPAVAEVARDDGEVDVRMRPSASVQALAEVLERVPDDADGGSVRLGRGRLAFDDPDEPEADVRGALVAVAAVRAPGGTNGGTGELRLRADGVADTGKAWRAATRALDLDRADRDDVEVYVDELVREGSEDQRRPVLSGPSDTRPDRALALLRALAASTTQAFTTTDLDYAQAQVRGPAAARSAATAARGARVRRASVSWPVPGEQAGATGDANDRVATTRLVDAPTTVLRLLPGIARAREAGIERVEWDRPPAIDVPQLRLATPDWIGAETTLEDRPALLRRLVRAVRTIDWPGSATFDLALGPGSCANYPKAQAVARIVSTSDGRARSVEPTASCTNDDTIRMVRRAWNATAG